MKIAILGAGAFGTALGGVLAEKGYDIDYYDPKLEQERLEDVVERAEVIVLAAPSKAVPHLLPHLPKNKPLIVATKGLLGDKMFANFEDLMVISGPGFAEDIKAGKNTRLTATDNRAIDMFTTDYLTFDLTDDKNGVLLCGSLKNVYAILAGILGLKRETAEWMKFIGDTSVEMKKILKLNRAKLNTVDLACGIGDLKLTCGYPSRNYEYGDILRKNPEYEPTNTVEGLTALRKIKRGEIQIPEDAVILKDLLARIG